MVSNSIVANEWRRQELRVCLGRRQCGSFMAYLNGMKPFSHPLSDLLPFFLLNATSINPISYSKNCLTPAGSALDMCLL